MRSYFSDDNNNLLKDIQAEFFSHVGGLLFTAPAMRYFQSTRFIGVETELFQKVKKALYVDGFSFTKLALPYHHMAAWYRFAKDDYGQIPLPFDGQTDYETVLRDKWLIFYRREVEILAQDDTIALLLIRLVVGASSEDIDSASKELSLIFKERYSIGQRRPSNEEDSIRTKDKL